MTINLTIYVENLSDAKEMVDQIESIVEIYDGVIKALEIKKGLFDE